MEYEVYGYVNKISLETAKIEARGEARKRGRPRQANREEVKNTAIGILASREKCWRKPGVPNASAVYNRMLLDHKALITKDNGDPFTKAWLRKRIKGIDDEVLEKVYAKHRSDQSD